MLWAGRGNDSEWPAVVRLEHLRPVIHGQEVIPHLNLTAPVDDAPLPNQWEAAFLFVGGMHETHA